MRVPSALAALSLSAALLLTLPATASAQVVPHLQTTVVEPAPGTAGTLPPAPVVPPAPIPDPPIVVPPSDPAPAPEAPAPAPAPSGAPAPAPAPTTPAPAPDPDPAIAPSSPAATPSPLPSSAEPDGGATAPAEEDEEVPGEVGRAEEVPAGGAVVPRTARTPAVSTAPALADRTSVPSASASTSGAAVVPGADEPEASPRLAAAEPAARYVAAGVLSIIAVVLALAIAVVAQPRRPRHTH